MNRSAFIAAIFLLAAFDVAAAPLTMNWAGRITDGAGRPATGPVDLEVHFFGSPAGTDEASVVLPPFLGVPLSDGMFQLELPLSDAQFHAVFAKVDQPVWIETRDLTNERVYPRQKFFPVPFALKVPVDGVTLKFDSVGQLKTNEIKPKAANTTATVTLRADDATPPTTVYTLPAAPDGGKYLKVDAGGVLSWDAPSGSGDITEVNTSGGIQGGVTNGAANLSLTDTGVAPAAYPKVTVDAKGRVTAGANLAYADIPVLDGAKVGLPNVEDTKLSTWTGSTAISTLGTVAAGTWQGTPVADAYVASAAAWNQASADALKWNGDATGLNVGMAKTSLGLDQVTNESKATMFDDSAFTGQATVTAGGIGEIPLTVAAPNGQTAHLTDWRVNGVIKSFVDASGRINVVAICDDAGNNCRTPAQLVSGMIGSNNLSEITNAATARSNIGAEAVANKGAASGYASLNGSSLVVQNPASATSTAATNSIVMTAGSSTISSAWLPNMVGDSGAGGTKGAVPAPGAGDAAANRYLKADGTWGVPAGTGMIGSNNLSEITNAATARSNIGAEAAANKGAASGYASLNGSSLVVQNPASATSTAATNSIVMTAGSSTISSAWLPNMVGDSGAGGTKGAVPAPGAGDAASGKFLKADGTWALLAASVGIASCPAGFTMIGTAGKRGTFCIDTTERTAAPWLTGKNTCRTASYSEGRANMCNHDQWYYACKDGGPTNMTNNWEYISDYSDDFVMVAGNTSCDDHTDTPPGNNYTYRCCIQ